MRILADMYHHASLLKTADYSVSLILILVVLAIVALVVFIFTRFRR